MGVEGLKSPPLVAHWQLLRALWLRRFIETFHFFGFFELTKAGRGGRKCYRFGSGWQYKNHSGYDHQLSVE